jgi:hypothetical protein
MGTCWQQWNLVNETRDIKGSKAVIRRTVKQDVTGTIGELIGAYIEMSTQLCRHVFTISHQFQHYKHLKETLSSDCALLVVDFSENYVCKQSRAVQSAHFGASNNQVCLHTGVVYFMGKMFSFCTVSSSTRHEPAAIWAHLQPVLEEIKRTEPSVKTLHFFSDGPTTQYRNKHHLLLSSHYVLEAGFRDFTWNYFEAGHGKSAADGVGGAIKRAADEAVDHGCTISTAAEFYTVLSEKSNIKLFLILEENINNCFCLIPPNVKPLAGTMKMHQFHVVEKGAVTARDFSCFCKFPEKCNCYNTRQVVFPSLVAAAKDIEVEHTTDQQEPAANACVDDGTFMRNIREAVEVVSNEQLQSVVTSVPMPDVGQWCIVLYDETHYIGHVLDKDEDEVYVSTMVCLGGNKFKFPRPLDKIWYKKENIVKIASAPMPTTRRGYCVSNDDWQLLCK